jgi:hypothetical protein
MDMFIRMRVMGLAGPVEVKPLKEGMAVETGADILGEIFVFSIGAGILAAEYYRSTSKEARREQYQLDQINEINAKLEHFSGSLQIMEDEIKELRSRVDKTENNKSKKK